MAMFLLSLIVFLPAAGAIALAFFPREKTAAIKYWTLAVTAVVFLLSVWIAIPQPAGSDAGRFSLAEEEVAGMQGLFAVPWIPSFNIQYAMGFDGISFPLVLLTTFITLLAMGASWNIDKHVKAYCMLFLILETGILGVFVSLDFFLFFVFWEVMLVPMYFLIGVWGGPRREYAAIKFFLYTLLGGVLMVIAILLLYFSSDLKVLSEEALVSTQAVATMDEAAAIKAAEGPQRTFNILALQQIGQHSDLFSRELLWGQSIQWWSFLLLFVGFIIKVPSVPLHTWLPDAHVEAPTPISMILAGILLKLGGYGIIRICYPICPEAGYELRYFVCGIGIVSMVYGAFVALAQKDFKRLVAYSSVSHMGYVVLGIGMWSAAAGTGYDPRYWQIGMNGAMFQMLAHGISSAGMFFMVGVIYDRVKHRELDKFGGLMERMPLYAAFSVGIFFAGMGLPGLSGFIGEVYVTISAWMFSPALAIVSACVLIITVSYILWTLQRVFLGTEYKGPNEDAIKPMTKRESWIAGPLFAFAILFGIFPQTIFNYMTPAVNKTVEQLADWTETNRPPVDTQLTKTDVD